MSALKLGRIWAAAPLTPNIDPGAAKYNLGWVAEIPVFQMLNYILNRYDTNIVAHAQRGVFEWGNDIDYKAYALVWDEVDGFIYLSKVASPSTATRPGANAAQWDKSAVQISRKQYDDAVAAWNAHMANTSNPHALTTEILDTYTKAVIDGKVATNAGNINTHIANHLNPHVVTAVQAGAVPVTGGDYSGLVRHLFASTGIGASTLNCSLLADATGAFLAKDTNARLGIDNLFKPVFIDNLGVKSNLLLDSNYLSAREAVEASYVVPTPDVQVDFRNNLNIIYGSGVSTFTGPAGSRGYVNKAGVTQTAALNAPRYTAQGLYLDGNASTEVLTIPTALNILSATAFSYCVEFKSTATTKWIAITLAGGQIAGVLMSGGQYQVSYVIGGVQTVLPIGAVDHTKPHKIVVTSDATGFAIYLDGVLKFSSASLHSVVTQSTFDFSKVTANWLPVYLIGFRTWFAALTPQQVSNL